MQTFGIVFVLVASIPLFVAWLEHRKGKWILESPLLRTGEVAPRANAAAASGSTSAGTVSCEGVVRSVQPFTAPCSGQPCVYFEVEIVREWTRSITTEKGPRTERGRDVIQSFASVPVFAVDDGTGPAFVTPARGMDVELETTFAEEQPIDAGTTWFGHLRVDVPPAPSDDVRVVGVKAVEKTVTPGGTLFVVGELLGGLVSRPQGHVANVRATRKGRDVLLGASTQRAKIALSLAAAVGVPGLLMATFGHPLPSAKAAGASSAACNILDVSKPGEPCTGRITSETGSEIPFRVTEAGTFVLTAGAPKGAIPLLATISLREEAGTVVASDLPGRAEVVLLPRDYVITVKDGIPGALKVKGGLSYEVQVERSALAPKLSPLVPPTPPTTPRPGITLGGPALSAMDTTTPPGSARAPTRRRSKR